MSRFFKTASPGGVQAPSISEVDLLSGVLSKTGDIIEGVGADQLSLPTPCDDCDVEALIHHIVGWLLVFEAGAQGRSHDVDAANHRCGADPAREFRTAAAGVVAGWGAYGFDRQVTALSGSMPGETVFTMTVMEYLTHGGDLAVATGQPIPSIRKPQKSWLARRPHCSRGTGARTCRSARSIPSARTPRPSTGSWHSSDAGRSRRRSRRPEDVLVTPRAEAPRARRPRPVPPLRPPRHHRPARFLPRVGGTPD
ncbi:TIGR03086 family metal-binding protein [Streptomyces sp. NPDC088252]|uniref:TIGR03086 family metal-binding protein n=1 Tax=unclassified Streptomyces TaxID=2593676 RepID=UPI0034178CA9